jgi:asparagine synthase (glutamine-hydrolysing)
MCGITGYWDPSSIKLLERDYSTLERMSCVLVHRGPDDCGTWLDLDLGVALAHRRLSIIDLSPLGHQPMVSSDERYVLVFNGEIYNFPNLRSELQALGHKFKGDSDTEVMLASFVEWGVGVAVQRLRGMFAFALWDRYQHILTLGRDRVGEKPLYYGRIGETFVFSSELKSFRQHPRWQQKISRSSISLLMRHNCIPAPYTIYEDIYKLLPGTTLTLHSPAMDVLPVPYWSARTVVEEGLSNPFTASDDEAIDELNTLLSKTISEQMLADVPLGAFLSGGIDSSLIVALMQAQSSLPIKTFSIGFEQLEYDESVHARAVAAHLKTQHTELYIDSQTAIDVIKRLPHLYDEPFSDSSQIPTFLVSQLAKQHVAVSLSGDAGDELFGGYNSYLLADGFWKKVGWVPIPLRRAAAIPLTKISPQQWNACFEIFKDILPQNFRVRLPGEKIHKLANILGCSGLEDLYITLASHWTNTSHLVIDGIEPVTCITNKSLLPKTDNFVQKMMYLDLMTYLPDDILVKVDRASMGVSLESRIPFLNHEIVEFAWRLPMHMKIRNGKSKWILRQLLYKYVPPQLVERPKMGFGVPIDTWLRTTLRDWAEDLIEESRLSQEGYFNPQPIREKWQQHLSGAHNWQHHLWNVLMFQQWMRSQSL